MARPIASLSLDLDNKWSYLKTHGDPGWESFPSYLDVVVPRFLELMDNLALRMTVFVVGQDAAQTANRDALRSIADAGHEIGNHSFHHEPWLHRYSREQLEKELDDAEDAIETATGIRPTGFRGPGFSFSPAVLDSLARRQYRYDASTFPTFVGPLARTYYFFTARLSDEQRVERKQLFGTWREGLRPIRPYLWKLESDSQDGGVGGQLLEIPVTTMPVSRLPMHVSYLLYLGQKSRAVAMAYWRWALLQCRVFGIGPSLLLHPLDFLGADDDSDLAFFPAMGMSGRDKVRLVSDVLRMFSECCQVVPMGKQAQALLQDPQLRIRRVDAPRTPADCVAAT